MANAKYQMTFHMGSGNPGAAVNKLLEDQTARLDIKEPTKTLRVALYALAKLKKDDPIIKEAIELERSH